MEEKQDYNQYVAEVFAKRLDDLGMTRYRFIRTNPIANQATLERMLYGRGGVNFNTVAKYADMLGLKLVFQVKDETDETYNKQETIS